MAYINELGSKLHEQGLLLEQEDDVTGFLGVMMTRTEEGLLEMSQTGIINRMLNALGLDSKLSTNKWMPVEAKPLTHEVDGEPCQGSFSYSSIVGMMLYLAGHAMPDTACAATSCVPYMFAP